MTHPIYLPLTFFPKTFARSFHAGSSALPILMLSNRIRPSYYGVNFGPSSVFPAVSLSDLPFAVVRGCSHRIFPWRNHFNPFPALPFPSSHLFKICPSRTVSHRHANLAPFRVIRRNISLLLLRCCLRIYPITRRQWRQRFAFFSGFSAFIQFSAIFLVDTVAVLSRNGC